MLTSSEFSIMISLLALAAIFWRTHTCPT